MISICLPLWHQNPAHYYSAYSCTNTRKKKEKYNCMPEERKETKTISYSACILLLCSIWSLLILPFFLFFYASHFMYCVSSTLSSIMNNGWQINWVWWVGGIWTHYLLVLRRYFSQESISAKKSLGMLNFG